MTMHIWTTVGGKQLYTPPPFPPVSCRDESPAFIITGQPEDPVVQLSNELLRLTFAYDVMQRGRDISEVYYTEHQIFPSTRAPREKPTVLYERDLVDELLPWMPVRSYLLEQAYRIDALLSVSLVPKEPQIRQTWYQSHVVKPIPPGTTPPDFTPVELYTATPKTITTEYMCGFVPPFSTYSSSLCSQDPRFDAIDSIFLTRCDIRYYLAPIPDESLRDKLSLLLHTFLEDAGAKSIALRFHCQGRAYLKRFHKGPNFVG